jgi:hypothetical protein
LCCLIAARDARRMSPLPEKPLLYDVPMHWH